MLQVILLISSILNSKAGDEIAFHLTCDSSARTVTFSSGFKMDTELTVSNQIILTPNKTTILTLRTDGTGFFQTSKAITVG